MSRHQRAQSTGDQLRAPHTVSLKVLRLSRPSLSYQSPLPCAADTLSASPKALLSYPGVPSATNHDSDSAARTTTNSSFAIAPLLKLPEAFGAAYVGETFACTLCANNEILPPPPPPPAPEGSDGQPKQQPTRVISGVRIVAEMQTPSTPAGAVLDLEEGAMDLEGGDGAEGDVVSPTQTMHGGKVLPLGRSLQRVLRFELKEEGAHVLAVTVTYTETPIVANGGEKGTTTGQPRVRTFRKLYQFVAQSLLSVRTKAGEIPMGRGKNGRTMHALEAQLENVGESAVSLEAVSLVSRPAFSSTSLNWDFASSTATKVPPQSAPHAPVLNPRDVIQVAFLVEQRRNTTIDEEDDHVLSPTGTKVTDRVALGQLAIQWRSAMGDRGSLSTGLLTSRRAT
ncbi:hypothetical protein BDY21DRAFT_332035 [Lineolata rhizophorae]|uniref:DUF974 domain-containing protein n=1 Tax=Lineolata rhizophorae TaxID=578093 RepID=A0A6A6PC42_9PEZI|nr:hypothetical protein BDY21DRAFT_332035 [Lineolata rhizophorae]